MADTAAPPSGSPRRKANKMFSDARRPRPRRTYRRHQFTADDYFKMDEMGLFWDQWVQLFDGVVYDVPTQTSAHSAACSLSTGLVLETYPDGATFWVLIQGSLKWKWTAPDPDLAVLPCAVGTPFNQQLPPLWVMDVSDTTYLADRHKKLKIYAANGVIDAWILNVNKRRLEVFRDPIKLAAPRRGWGYQTEFHLIEGQSVTPLNGPPVTFQVSDLLPPRP